MVYYCIGYHLAHEVTVSCWYKDNFRRFRPCWVDIIQTIVQSICPLMTSLALMAKPINLNWLTMKCLKITFMEPQDTGCESNQSIWIFVQHQKTRMKNTGKKSHTTSMPPSEACFPQRAHPGETEYVSCGDKTIFLNSMKCSFFQIYTCSVSFAIAKLSWVRGHDLSS